MLLALWAGFPLTSWTGVVVTPANVILPDGGSKRGKRNYKQVEWPRGHMYEYLEAREQHLRRLNTKKKKKRVWQMPTPAEVYPESKPYQEPVNEPQPIVARSPEKIPPIPTTKMFAMHLKKIDSAQQAVAALEARVNQTQQQMDDEAIELLLLS